MTDPSTGPPDAVLVAFGATHPAESLPGGMGEAWRSGDMVFKRSGAPIAWLAWEERVSAAVPAVGVRIQQIRRAHDGALSVDGWVARDYLAGDHRSRRWIGTVPGARPDLLANHSPTVARTPAVRSRS